VISDGKITLKNNMDQICFEAEVSEVQVKVKNLDRITKIVLLVPESEGKHAEQLTQYINSQTVHVVIVPKV
jgi:hypothetical protein